jgi:hypothetical protein
MSENLLQGGDPFDDPRWKATKKPTHARRRSEAYIGCPVAWLKRVLPIVKSKDQLAVALYLHRRRVVCGNEVFSIPNAELYAALGITRQTKYRTLRHLEQAGVIALVRDGRQAIRARLL